MTKKFIANIDIFIANTHNCQYLLIESYCSVFYLCRQFQIYFCLSILFSIAQFSAIHIDFGGICVFAECSLILSHSTTCLKCTHAHKETNINNFFYSHNFSAIWIMFLFRYQRFVALFFKTTHKKGIFALQFTYFVWNKRIARTFSQNTNRFVIDISKDSFYEKKEDISYR